MQKFWAVNNVYYGNVKVVNAMKQNSILIRILMEICTTVKQQQFPLDFYA